MAIKQVLSGLQLPEQYKSLGTIYMLPSKTTKSSGENLRINPQLHNTKQPCEPTGTHRLDDDNDVNDIL